MSKVSDEQVAELAKAFHDGPLMADDHEFVTDSGQGRWCLQVAEFFIERLSALEAVSSIHEAGQYHPQVIHYDGEGDGYHEFINADVMSITDTVEARNVEAIRAIDGDRPIIGFRIYDAHPNPISKGVTVKALGNNLDPAGLEAAEIAWTGDRRIGLYLEQKAGLAAAIAAYLACLSHTEEGRRVVWLIERSDIEPSPQWYGEREDGFHSWTPDASLAKPFQSKAEAEAFPAYRMIASDKNVSITEHVFIDRLSHTAGEIEAGGEVTGEPVQEMHELSGELMGLYYALDGHGPGDGRFTIQMENGEAEQTRLNLRAVLREGSVAIEAADKRIAELMEVLTETREWVELGPELPGVSMEDETDARNLIIKIDAALKEQLL